MWINMEMEKINKQWYGIDGLGNFLRANALSQPRTRHFEYSASCWLHIHTGPIPPNGNNREILDAHTHRPYTGHIQGIYRKYIGNIYQKKKYRFFGVWGCGSGPIESGSKNYAICPKFCVCSSCHDPHGPHGHSWPAILLIIFSGYGVWKIRRPLLVRGIRLWKLRTGSVITCYEFSARWSAVVCKCLLSCQIYCFW